MRTLALFGLIGLEALLAGCGGAAPVKEAAKAAAPAVQNSCERRHPGIGAVRLDETRQGSARDKWGVSAGAYREVADGIGVALQAEFFDQAGSAGPIGTLPTYSTTYSSNTSGAGGLGSSTSSLDAIRRTSITR